MKTTHGRIGQEKEYIETKLLRPRLNVVAQKAGSGWYLYLVAPGPAGAVKTVGYYATSEEARYALDIAAATLTTYVGM